MFEAIHGSAPRRAGQNLANPTGLLLAAIQMLVHLDLTEEASKIKNGWLKTLEDGLHTYDIYRSGHSQKKVGTKEFGQAVEERLGEKPKHLKPAHYSRGEKISVSPKTFKEEQKQLVGADVFIDGIFKSAASLAEQLKKLEGDSLKLQSISNRGIIFWPGVSPLSDKTDHWRCRFMSPSGVLSQRNAIDLLARVAEAQLDCIKTENLYNFDGKPGFSSISRLDS